MKNPLREQLIRDMTLAGLSAKTQKTYVGAIDVFVRRTWKNPQDAEEADLQSFLIDLRNRDHCGETFRVYRYALQFLFENTLRQDWPIFKKNFEHPPSGDCPTR
jgi:hypothetical protein